MAITFHHAVLDNGLTVIAEVDPDANSAAAGFFVKTGARDETSADMGVSHFLEHMMFKGTDRRSAEDVDRDFDEIGATHNAFTTSELTAFWAHCLPEHLADASVVLADILRPSIRDDDFNDEKKVIIEEIAMYRDQPIWVLYERAIEVYYGTHPLSHRVLGTDETVTDLARDSMLTYFNNRYSADNTVLAMAGRLDFDAMLKLAGEQCGHWQRTDATRATAPFTPTPQRFAMDLPTINRHYILQLSPAPSISDPRRYAAMMLTQVLGDHDGSRLYWALVDPGIADEAVAEYHGRDGTGEYLLYASCSPDDAEKVEAMMKREVEALVDSINDDDLMRVRNKIATSVTLQGELPGGRMRRLGQIWTYQGEYTSLDEELERINAVTVDDLRTVAAEFPIGDTITGSLTPSAGEVTSS